MKVTSLRTTGVRWCCSSICRTKHIQPQPILMNKINGSAWVEALRSGKYVQGKNALHQINGQGCEHTYCCLGVVTELAVTAGVLPAGVLWEVVQENARYHYLAYETWGQTSGFLPESVGKWLEINECIDFQIDGRTESPVTLNDVLGYSFYQIADLIEAKYLQQPIKTDESD